MKLIDDRAGRILQVLDEQQLWQDTLIMHTPTTDRRGDFGLYGEGNFSAPASRMPAFIVPPKRSREPGRFSGLVEMFDYAPTMLDCAGLPVPEEMAVSSPRKEIETGCGGRDTVFEEYLTNQHDLYCVCCRTATHKLVLWSSRGQEAGELYCLAEDPHELVNRFDDPGLASVRQGLVARIVERGLSLTIAR
jgi:arylsulfatase